MELRHLRYFVGVAEVENVSRAAEKLHVSQPPLTRQIKQLEDELGVPLFERSAKSLRLTEAGKVFEREAKRILEEVDKAVTAARETAGLCMHELNIGYAPSLTVAILPCVLRLIQERFPGMRTRLHDLTTSNMVKQLKGSTLDFALMVNPGAPALRGCVFHEIHRHPACVVLPKNHFLSDKQIIDVEDLVNERVITFTRSDYPEYHRWLSSIFKSTGRAPPTFEEHDSITSLIASVHAENGIAFGCDGFQEMAGSRLLVKKLAGPAPPISVGVAWRQPPKDDSLQSLLDLLVTAFPSHT